MEKEIKNRLFTLNNGVKLPAIGYGSYLATANRGYETVLEALNSGYRYIDTAYFYMNEDEIGRAIKESGLKREELFIASKVWPSRFGYNETRKCFEESLSKLGTDYLDLYLLHWPKLNQSDNDWLIKMLESWSALEDLYKEGKIRAIGVSNFLPHHLKPLLKAAKVKPMVNQLELHAGYMQWKAVEYSRENDIQIQAWSPLGRGALLNNPLVVSMADKYGKSSAQILLKYLLDKDISIIPKASSSKRMIENSDIWDITLDETDTWKLDCMPETGFSGEHPDTVNF